MTSLQYVKYKVKTNQSFFYSDIFYFEQTNIVSAAIMKVSDEVITQDPSQTLPSVTIHYSMMLMEYPDSLSSGFKAVLQWLFFGLKFFLQI